VDLIQTLFVFITEDDDGEGVALNSRVPGGVLIAADEPRVSVLWPYAIATAISSARRVTLVRFDRAEAIRTYDPETEVRRG